MRRGLLAHLVAVGFALVPPLAAAGACSAPTRPVAAAEDVAPRLDAAIHPDASCMVTVDSPPLLPAMHVPINTDVQYDSNPPSSGPHYPYWAAYQAFTTPVDRRYYVHNLEHGAIVFLYRCDDGGGCPDVAAALQMASNSLPDDPLCSQAGEGVRVRTVITPDPLIDTPVAAAAWGWTYTADCIDLPTLEAFAAAHYGQGPELLCTNGLTQF